MVNESNVKAVKIGEYDTDALLCDAEFSSSEGLSNGLCVFYEPTSRNNKSDDDVVGITLQYGEDESLTCVIPKDVVGELHRQL